MSIASDIATAATQIASGLATIEAQLDILEVDRSSDPQTFYGAAAGGSARAFAPNLVGRVATIKRRMDGLTVGA